MTALPATLIAASILVVVLVLESFVPVSRFAPELGTVRAASS